jgi:glycine cleavage system regulatory protein
MVYKPIMHSVMILTVSGRDQAGLVEELATIVAAHRGNWEICRMAHLSGRFVGLLQLKVPSDEQQELEIALRTIKGLDVQIAAGSSLDAEPIVQFNLEVLGSDHSGIVRDVFAALARAKINVEELSTRTFSAPDSGVILFEAKARLSCRQKEDLDLIRVELERIAHDVMVDIRVL